MLPRLFHRMMGNETRKQVFLPNTTDFGILENMLQNPDAMPMCLPMDFLKAITRDFSEEQELGRGGFGVVYKGVLQNGKTIAVKKLSEMHLEDAQFQNEVTYLIGLKHKNIVQLVGYCAESRWEAAQLSGKYIMAEIRKRLLCFEYLNNKSLDKHLSAESCGLEWHRRYEIIKGICCGLHYLHMECRIMHLDLKPGNILLDENMVPKIADFGMSRLFGQQQSRIITESRGGTLGYMAPEYLTNGFISTKSDIFSLGVIIIELMTGSRDYPQNSDACFGNFIENVVGKWRDRLEKTPRYIPFKIYSQQVNTCIVIGLSCVDPDPKKRPAALEMIQMLNAVESMNRRTAESQISTVSSSCTANTSNSGMDFSKILNRASISRNINISRVFTFSAKGTQISILSFEVANTIFMGFSLMKIFSKQSMKLLNEGVLLSEGVRRLISEDHSQLLVLVEANIREELKQFSTNVARFGDLFENPQWHNLDKFFSSISRYTCSDKLQPELAPQKSFTETAISNIEYLIKLAQCTAELYREMFALDALEKLYMGLKDPSMSNVIRTSVKNQRNVVKNLKRKSLWSKTVDEILEKLVDIVKSMHLEINNAFLKNDGDQSVKPASNLRQTLGPAGLALHYANVILQINTLAWASPVVVRGKARDALYQALPPSIKSKLRTCLPKEKTMVAEARAEMDRILQWLVPVAESTRLYYKNGEFGEWAMKGMEDVDFDEAQWSGQEERQIIVSAMLTHENAKVNKIETLYHADKERTEYYMLYLVCGLHRLVC